LSRSTLPLPDDPDDAEEEEEGGKASSDSVSLSEDPPFCLPFCFLARTGGNRWACAVTGLLLRRQNAQWRGVNCQHTAHTLQLKVCLSGWVSSPVGCQRWQLQEVPACCCRRGPAPLLLLHHHHDSAAACKWPEAVLEWAHCNVGS
jgi:hypothetical protein